MLSFLHNSYGKELTEIFHGFGEEKDDGATGNLDDKLDRCPISDQQAQVRMAVGRARQIAEQFIEDFGRLEGT